VATKLEDEEQEEPEP